MWSCKPFLSFVSPTRLCQVVGPKQESLLNAEESLGEQLAKLEVKQSELNSIKEKLTGLQMNLDEKQTEKEVGRENAGAEDEKELPNKTYWPHNFWREKVPQSTKPCFPTPTTAIAQPDPSHQLVGFKVKRKQKWWPTLDTAMELVVLALKRCQTMRRSDHHVTK